MERNGKGRENANVTGREMYALKLRERTQQELKEVQYGGLSGKVRMEFQEKPRLSWGSVHLGLRQSISNSRIISVCITAVGY